MAAAAGAPAVPNLVIPGQVIAVWERDGGGGSSGSAGGAFLRGHGTFVETDGEQERLIASVVGTIVRTNQLVSVVPVAATVYAPHVGDLVVGRIAAVQASRWQVQLVENGRLASLPLSGVHLPGGLQRMRNAQDARNMQELLREGDVVAAEVHRINNSDGSVMLHTRSQKVGGLLENGEFCRVHPALVPRRPQHAVSVLDNAFDVLFGCNGGIWLQRSIKSLKAHNNNNAADGETMQQGNDLQELTEIYERQKEEHAASPLSSDERRQLARLRNCVQVLQQMHVPVTSEALESLFRASLELNVTAANLLESHTMVKVGQAGKVIPPP